MQLNRAFYGLPDLTNYEGLHTNAVLGFLNIIFKIMDEEKPDHMCVAFDVHEPTFRHLKYSAYKGTRKPMPEELREQVPLMKEVLTAMHVTIVEKGGYEADDIIGTISRMAERDGYATVIVSGDRDLLQLATDTILVRIPKTKATGTTIENYYAKDVVEAYGVTPVQFIDMKGLMGDTSDNIPGVPGIGEKTAAKLMIEYGSMENILDHLDTVKPPRVQKNLTENMDLAVMSKDLATIKLDCKLDVSLDEMTIESLFNEDSYKIFKRLGFNSLLKKFDTVTEAAEIGTRKVIAEHSTIGIVITTDGSISDIPREDYLEPEERVIRELQELGKPFIVLLNSEDPKSDRTLALAGDIASRYQVKCRCANCLALTEEDINGIIRELLYQFPLQELDVFLPPWVDALPGEHPVKAGIYEAIRQSMAELHHIREIDGAVKKLGENENISEALITAIDLGTGVAAARVSLPREMFYRTLSEQSGFDVGDDGDLMSLLTKLAGVKTEYDKVAGALRDVRETGYGIVVPGIDELKLEEPEIMKQGGRDGVRLKASAPSIHMIRADIETAVSPIVGNEKQSEDMVNYLLQEFEGDTSKIWQSNIFGRSFHEVVSDDLQTKLKRMPENARKKLQETLPRIINEGSGGLICIIL